MAQPSESTQLQQAQLAAILGPDTAPFETLISHLMSSSNEQRSQAELLFNLCKQTDPDSLSLKLAHLLQFSPHPEGRAMSAILLRKQLTRDDSYLWPRLNPNTQSSLKSILLACIQREETKSIAKKLCDTVSELASGILPDNGRCIVIERTVKQQMGKGWEDSQPSHCEAADGRGGREKKVVGAQCS